MKSICDKIIRKLEETGNIKFTNFSKPLIAVEDATKIVEQVAVEDEQDHCDHCKHVKVGMEGYPCNQCQYNYISKFEPKPKKTNADRIREMSDEELAFVIMCPYDTAGDSVEIMPCVKDGSNMCVGPERCMQCTKAWLEKECL